MRSTSPRSTSWSTGFATLAGAAGCLMSRRSTAVLRRCYCWCCGTRRGKLTTRPACTDRASCAWRMTTPRPSVSLTCSMRSGCAQRSARPGTPTRGYINSEPNAAQLDAGVGPLVELLALLPRLQVVMLLVSHAQKSWRRLGKRKPEIVEQYRAIATRHPSNQASIGLPEQRAGWRAEQLDAFREAAAVLRGEARPPRVTSELWWCARLVHGWRVGAGPSDSMSTTSMSSPHAMARASSRR